MGGRQLLVLTGMFVAHRPRRIRRCVWDTVRWHTWRGGNLKQSKLSKCRQIKSRSWKWKACTDGVPLWLSPSGSLHFKGTVLLGYASLTGASLLGKFFMEWSWFGCISVCLIFWSEMDFPMQCHWLASWLPMGLAFSTLLLCVSCLHHQIWAPMLILPLALFFFLNLPCLKQIFQKKKKLLCSLHQFWN